MQSNVLRVNHIHLALSRSLFYNLSRPLPNKNLKKTDFMLSIHASIFIFGDYKDYSCLYDFCKFHSDWVRNKCLNIKNANYKYSFTYTNLEFSSVLWIKHVVNTLDNFDSHRFSYSYGTNRSYFAINKPFKLYLKSSKQKQFEI